MLKRLYSKRSTWFKILFIDAIGHLIYKSKSFEMNIIGYIYICAVYHCQYFGFLLNNNREFGCFLKQLLQVKKDYHNQKKYMIFL